MAHAPVSEIEGPPPVDRARATRRMLVIWNPDAGDGDGDVGARRDLLHAALTRHGIDADVFESHSEEDAQRRVRQALGQATPVIVAAGGDGTVRSIAFQLLGHEVVLGILPGGTAMNVARSLGIPLDLDGAAAVLAAGHVRPMDVGEVRDQPLLEIASIGLGAEMLAGATHVSEGRFRDALELLRTALRSRRTRVRLQLDGREVRTRALSIAVANGRFTGRGIELAPDASLDDGRFDVLVYEGVGGLELGVSVARVLLGRGHDERVSRYTAGTVRISTHRPLPIRMDSQDLGVTPASFVTRRAALQVIAPPTRPT